MSWKVSDSFLRNILQSSRRIGSAGLHRSLPQGCPRLSPPPHLYPPICLSTCSELDGDSAILPSAPKAIAGMQEGDLSVRCLSASVGVWRPDWTALPSTEVPVVTASLDGVELLAADVFFGGGKAKWSAEKSANFVGEKSKNEHKMNFGTKGKS